MASEVWIGPNRSASNPGSGNLSVAANWSGNRVPGASDEVDLIAQGAIYEVFVDQNESIGSLLNQAILDIKHQLTIKSTSLTKTAIVDLDDAVLSTPDRVSLVGGGRVINLIDGDVDGDYTSGTAQTFENDGNTITGYGTHRAGARTASTPNSTDRPPSAGPATRRCAT